MSIIFMDSFDDGLSGAKWTFVGTATAIGGTPRTGTAAANLSSGFGSNPEGASLHMSAALADQHTTFIIGFGLRQQNFPVSNAAFMQIDAAVTPSTTVRFSFRRENDGSISVWSGGTGTLNGFPSGITNGGTIIAQSDPNVIRFGQYYHIETKLVAGAVAGTIEVRVNGTTVASFTGNTGTATFKTVILGTVNDVDSNAAGVFIDDFVLMNGAGATNNDFIGDSRVQNFLPNGNGNYSELIGQDADSIDNYLNVDEAAPDSGTTYNGGATSGDQDSYAFPNLPTNIDTVRGVAQRAFAANSDATDRNARHFVRIAGTDYNSAEFTLPDTPYVHYEIIYNVSPATAVAFTPAEFDGAEWGFEVRA